MIILDFFDLLGKISNMIIARTVLSDLKKELTNPEVKILLGPRQVGKTTLLREIEKFSKTLNKKTSFFDLEQPDILAAFNINDAQIITMLKSSGNVIFIDEFQYLQNASKIFKAIYDSGHNIKVFCSGSSSLEIHKHLKESLAGRRFLFNILPLSFSEIHKKFKTFPFDTYLIYGGMPALTHTNDKERKQQILSELLNSYILKDIKSLVKEENIRAFNHLLYLLAERQGSTISIHSLANQIGLSSKGTNRYLDILEGTYVNFRIFSYSNNLGNELKKSCKTYLYDLGLRNMILKDFSDISDRSDKGTLFESYVFLKLKSILKPNMEIKFWRTKDGNEVDFILSINRKPIPIEVKSSLKKPAIPAGLKIFLKRYPKTKKAYIVNQSLSTALSHNNCTIQFITFEAFEQISSF
jgi:uncharacterized protein